METYKNHCFALTLWAESKTHSESRCKFHCHFSHFKMLALALLPFWQFTNLYLMRWRTYYQTWTFYLKIRMQPGKEVTQSQSELVETWWWNPCGSLPSTRIATVAVEASADALCWDLETYWDLAVAGLHTAEFHRVPGSTNLPLGPGLVSPTLRGKSREPRPMGGAPEVSPPWHGSDPWAVNIHSPLQLISVLSDLCGHTSSFTIKDVWRWSRVLREVTGKPGF